MALPGLISTVLYSLFRAAIVLQVFHGRHCNVCLFVGRFARQKNIVPQGCLWSCYVRGL